MNERNFEYTDPINQLSNLRKWIESIMKTIPIKSWTDQINKYRQHTVIIKPWKNRDITTKSLQ